MKSFRMLSPAGLLALTLLGAFFSPGTLSAQVSKARSDSWENLKILTPGQEIRLATKNAKSYQGKFVSLSNGGITVLQRAGEQTVGRKDVLRVSREIGQEHSKENLLIGMALGAVAGLGVGLIADHVIWRNVNCDEGASFNCSGPPNPHWGAILAPIGAVAGAAIGQYLPTGRWHDVYRAR